ncbi:pyrophosphate--fructose 6-phosphate1-phosphotransferase subunit alpha [Striga asiatica]|uniref:Pyrophosphate--fructose 6-phosphate1-phosphotransferase subunit alpha n=1 Tax=Striga asiatica TaxID=4170 RepID=A0A5A7R8V3_STRAF|nr:pyrophosphate--fructose 6-phosphate1-phosphotransferase subunit alpha [Striga asiatica]
MKFQYECPTFCCDNGKVKLSPIEVPDELYELFTSQTEEGKQFRINIRLFNSMFSFTSLGVKLDKELASARQGIYTFRAQGVVYHDLPSLWPKEDGPEYFQLYFVETEREVDNRMGIFPNSSLSKSTVKKLINVLNNFGSSDVFIGFQKKENTREENSVQCATSLVLKPGDHYHQTSTATMSGLNGYMATVTNLKDSTNKWRCTAVPLAAMMSVRRHLRGPGAVPIRRPVIHPSPIDLKAESYAVLREKASSFLLDDFYRTPGGIQFEGPGAGAKPITLTIEEQDYLGDIEILQAYLEKVRTIPEAWMLTGDSQGINKLDCASK